MRNFFIVLLCALGLSGCEVLLDAYVYFYGFSDDKSFRSLGARTSSVFNHVQSDGDGVYFDGGDMTIRLPEAALWQNGAWNEKFKRYQTSSVVYYRTGGNAAVPTSQATHILSISCALENVRPVDETSEKESQHYREISCPDAPEVILGISLKTKRSGQDIFYKLSIYVKSPNGTKTLVGESNPTSEIDATGAHVDRWEETHPH